MKKNALAALEGLFTIVGEALIEGDFDGSDKSEIEAQHELARLAIEELKRPADGQLVRHIRATLAHVTGLRYQHFDYELEQLSVIALRDLNRLLRDVEEEITKAQRTIPLWPGGPSITT